MPKPISRPKFPRWMGKWRPAIVFRRAENHDDQDRPQEYWGIIFRNNKRVFIERTKPGQPSRYVRMHGSGMNWYYEISRRIG